MPLYPPLPPVERGETRQRNKILSPLAPFESFERGETIEKKKFSKTRFPIFNNT
jgi:hypothetical protein